MIDLTWLLDLTFRRNSRRGGTRTTRRPTYRKLQMETLDGRLMMSATPAPDWFSKNLPDTAIANLARQDYTAHSSVSRADMLAIFAQVDKDGSVSADEFASLQTMSRNAGAMGMPEYVRQLLSKTAVDDPANRIYQFNSHPVSGHATGDLYAGSTSAQLDSLVNKWFKGTDLPSTAFNYKASTAPLFANGVSYADVDQAAINDCTLMASIAEVAARNSSYIQDMFIANSDGTYTVRLYRNGLADYLTVNTMLPEGGTVFAQVSHSDGTKYVSELWVALTEKAIVQENASGGVYTLHSGVNAYSAIDGGNVNTAKGYLAALTGLKDSDISVNPTNVADAMKQGKMVLLGTGDKPSDPHLVANHCYAVVYYDASSSQPFRIFNPWGILSHFQNGQTYWGQVTAGPSYINSGNFDMMVRTNAGEPSELVSMAIAAASFEPSHVTTAVTASPTAEIRIDAVQPAAAVGTSQAPGALHVEPLFANVKRAPVAARVDDVMANWGLDFNA